MIDNRSFELHFMYWRPTNFRSSSFNWSCNDLSRNNDGNLFKNSQQLRTAITNAYYAEMPKIMIVQKVTHDYASVICSCRRRAVLR